MPGPRSLPPRSSQRRNTQEEEPIMRTRSGRGPKSAAKADQPDLASPKAVSKDSSNAPLTRKATRSASNNSSYAQHDSADEIFASYEKPLFMVFGLTPEFLDSLEEREQLKPAKRGRTSTRTELPALSTLFSHQDSPSSDEDSSSEESDVPVPSPPAPRGRGRGGRGSRGGRARGSRGRGRGGRGRGAIAGTTSPLRTRPSRTAAPMFPLTEEDDEEPSNQDSPMVDAKDSPEPEEEDEQATSDDDVEQSGAEADEKSDEDDMMQDVQADASTISTTPLGEPPFELVQAYDDPLKKIPVPLPVPKISLPKESTRVSMPAERNVPKLLAPEDDVLSDSDLPDPWLEDQAPPVQAECDDLADYLLKTRFKPMTDVSDIIASLTKFPLSQRRTENLYALAENTQIILKAWQDEYLMLDSRTAPHAHPPKKPCNGGRVPRQTVLFEDEKEADLYGYTYDHKKGPGMQDPFTQRPGHENSNGRELRQRRTRDMLDSAAPSEEEEEDEEGRPTKRQRRATRRFEGSDQGTGSNTPKKHNGWGGARKKGVSKYAQPAASQTPEPDGRGKRGKAAANALLHQRIQAMREESAVTSSGDEGSSNINSGDGEDHLVVGQKRGRPAGSKNTGRRSDYGMKKGPRKRVYVDDAPAPSAHGPNAPSSSLQSLGEGQIQFAVDPPMGTNVAPPIVGPHSTETVFQATPQPTGGPDIGGFVQVKAQTPENYMNTTPLSQYSGSYVDDSASNSASGPRKKQPRVKSEKRSQSMTIWWAERKARAKELEKETGTPAKAPTSRSSSSTGRRGGRQPAGASSSRPHPPPEEQTRHTSMPHNEPAPLPTPQDPYPVQYQPLPPPPPPPPPFSASSPNNMYAPMTYPPPPPMMIAPSPLTAVPSGPTSHPPPPSPLTAVPSGPLGPRSLAPAPLAPQLPQSYPSPYGPRTAPRPKSNGPPPLAPAPPPPPHVSPYPPMAPGQAAQPTDMPFKVLIPGPPPSDEQRRGSR